MELTISYIISQIFTFFSYMFLTLTYYTKNRNLILIWNFLSITSMILVYILLKAYTGLAMSILALIRTIVFMVDERKNGKKEKNDKKDVIILVILYILTIALTIPTYDGFLSLLSVFATMMFTYSIWQKKTITYRLLGIPTESLWLLYNIYIDNKLGIVLESIVLIFFIAGYILLLKETKQNKLKMD